MPSIRFHRVNDPYGALSNFAPYPILLDGRRWPTSEHYFQAQKFAGTEHEEEIRTTPSPMMAARKARSRSRPLRSDWEQVKDAVMLRAVDAKFSQHPELRALLLSTADAELVEPDTVVVAGPVDDLLAHAAETLARWGPVQPGSPQGDFSVGQAKDGVTWVVGGGHPDILTAVRPDETSEATEVLIGLVGRAKRDHAAANLRVLHVQSPGRLTSGS